MSQRDIKLAEIGLMLLIPALLLCAGGFLQSFLGTTQLYDSVQALHLGPILFNPVILLGGLTLAFVLNLIPVFRVSYQDGSLIGSVKLRGRALNLAVLAFVGLMMTTIFLYLLAENFQVFATFA